MEREETRMQQALRGRITATHAERGSAEEREGTYGYTYNLRERGVGTREGVAGRDGTLRSRGQGRLRERRLRERNERGRREGEHSVIVMTKGRASAEGG